MHLNWRGNTPLRQASNRNEPKGTIMNVQRRCAVGLVALSLVLTAGFAAAQPLKHLPPGPVVIIKINKPEEASKRLGGIMQRLGLPALQPALADPLGSFRQQMGIQQGLDAKRDIVIAVYPEADEDDQQMIVLLPVTDYQAFLKNFEDVQVREGVAAFEIEGAEAYSANWGSYAALSPDRAILTRKPTGVQLPAAAAGLLDKGDAVVWFDIRQLAAGILPEFREGRQEIIQEMEQQAKASPNFNQKFLPALRALLVSALDVAEGALQHTQWQTLTLNIADKGISMSSVTDFTAGSYPANLVGSYKAGDGALLSGLPERRYFAFGGLSIDGPTLTRALDDFIGPAVAELRKAGPEGEAIIRMFDAARSSLAATRSIAMGYAQPAGQPGQQAIMQPVAIYQGDAKKIAEGQRQSMEGVAQLMNFIPQDAEVSFSFKVQEKAKVVDGVALDSFRMDVKFDANDPMAAQQAQMMQMMYGANGMAGVMGAVSDKAYIVVMADNEELLAAVVAAAKKGESPMAQLAGVKAVTAELPGDRVMVEYIALDNIVTTAMQYAQMFLQAPDIKLPPNLPPIGVSVSPQGSTIRGEAFIPIELIDGLVGGVMRMIMNQGGGAAPGAL
jgi:hypothetical protein